MRVQRSEGHKAALIASFGNVALANTLATSRPGEDVQNDVPGVRFTCPAISNLQPVLPAQAMQSLRPRLCWWPADEKKLVDAKARPGTLEMAMGQFVGEGGAAENSCADTVRKWSTSLYLQPPGCSKRPVFRKLKAAGNRSGCHNGGPGIGAIPNNMDPHLHVVLQFGIAFLSVYKAGSRTLLAYLSRLGSTVEMSLQQALNYAFVFPLLFFAFVRDPAPRFFSGYEEVTYIQYRFPLDASTGLCPEKPLDFPHRSYPSGTDWRSCNYQAKLLRLSGYGRIPLGHDDARLAQRFRSYVRHQVHTSGVGSLYAEDHTWSQISFILGTYPDGSPWVPNFVGRLERLQDDLDEIVHRASKQLPWNISAKMKELHAKHRWMLDPSVRASRSFSTRENPTHRSHQFYFAALEAEAGACEDFCKSILQDSVCLGYALPEVCAKCGRARRQNVSLLRTRWRQWYQEENCKFFSTLDAWGGTLQREWWCRRQN